MREQVRGIARILKSKPTIEGAGVRLMRAFGYDDLPIFDPFLMLDDFSSSDPNDYVAGFPWHPHRGIETVTYMLEGSVAHEDSMGNKGTIDSGDIQWMTAGSGVIHQEMPQAYKGRMRGFQLWINLPASHKMMAPRYQEIKKDSIPWIEYSRGVYMRLIAGSVNDTRGPVEDLIAEPICIDITIEPNTTFEYDLDPAYTAACYVIEGEALFGTSTDSVGEGHAILFSNGDFARAVTKGKKMRMLLIAGKPLKEPIEWYGPIVMNTEEEMKRAFEELENGTFVRTEQKDS